jgi:hypothetical protein
MGGSLARSPGDHDGAGRCSGVVSPVPLTRTLGRVPLPFSAQHAFQRRPVVLRPTSAGALAPESDLAQAKLGGSPKLVSMASEHAPGPTVSTLRADGEDLRVRSSHD